MIKILWEGLLQGLLGVWSVARIVIPLMIVLEIAQANGFLERINRFFARPFYKIGLSEEGAFPVVVAVIFGLTFGSGVILNHTQTGKLTKAETKIVGTFIALSHALIEDTIIFVSLGAPVFLLVIPRLVVAYLVSYFVHLTERKKVVLEGDHS